MTDDRTDELRRAASEVGVDVAELPADACQALRQTLLRTYAPLVVGNPRWIWEHLHDVYGSQNPDGWRVIGAFRPDQRVVVLFNPCDDERMLEFASGADVVASLAESCGFEAYFTDRQASYLLIHNHHDWLLACGLAKDWVRQNCPEPAPRRVSAP